MTYASIRTYEAVQKKGCTENCSQEKNTYNNTKNMYSTYTKTHINSYAFRDGAFYQTLPIVLLFGTATYRNQ